MVNLIYNLANGNTVSNNVDERSDIENRGKDMAKYGGYKGSNNNPVPGVKA